MTEYTDKERMASAEAVLLCLAENTNLKFIEKRAIDHFDKYTKPDPDKELKKEFSSVWADYGHLGNEGLFKKLDSSNLLATSSVLQAERVNVLDEIITLWKDSSISGSVFAHKLEELRTKYTEGE